MYLPQPEAPAAPMDPGAEEDPEDLPLAAHAAARWSKGAAELPLIAFVGDLLDPRDAALLAKLTSPSSFRECTSPGGSS